jgi:putative membrane protein
MKQNKLNSCLAAVAAALICTAPSRAADVSSKEKSFIKDALEASMAETKLGEVAQTKASRPDVKAFAKMMVEHHSASTADLKKLADLKGVKYEDALGVRHSSAVDKLDKYSGGEFDKEFLDQMVSDHEKVIKDFEDASKDAKDPDVKALIDKMLPVLRGHYNKAKALRGDK